MPEEDDEVKYLLRLPALLKSAAKRRAKTKDLSLAQYLRGLIRADLGPSDEISTTADSPATRPSG